MSLLKRLGATSIGVAYGMGQRHLAEHSNNYDEEKPVVLAFTAGLVIIPAWASYDNAPDVIQGAWHGIAAILGREFAMTASGTDPTLPRS